MVLIFQGSLLTDLYLYLNSCPDSVLGMNFCIKFQLKILDTAIDVSIRNTTPSWLCREQRGCIKRVPWFVPLSPRTKFHSFSLGRPLNLVLQAMSKSGLDVGLKRLFMVGTYMGLAQHCRLMIWRTCLGTF